MSRNSGDAIPTEVLEGRTHFWKDGPIQTFQEFLNGVDGTRFSNVVEVRSFLRKMEEPGQIPFANGVVIYVPPDNGNRRGLAKFHDVFEEIISRHGKKIKRLVYCMFNYLGDGDIHYQKQLANICKLSNLESLAIYHGACFDATLYPPDASDLYKGLVYQVAPKLRELLIFPFENENVTTGGYLDPPHLINYLTLIPNFIESLECLQFPWKRKEYPENTLYFDNLSLLQRFDDNLKTTLIPKLQKLKIILSRDQFDAFADFCQPEKAPNLRQVSLLLGPMRGNELENAMKFLDGFASSLEFIHLYIDEEATLTAEDLKISPNLEVPYDWAVDYPKLKHASIGVLFFIADPPAIWEIIRKKFAQLKILSEIEKKKKGGRMMSMPEMPLSDHLAHWATLPATLEEIRVPHQAIVLKREELYLLYG